MTRPNMTHETFMKTASLVAKAPVTLDQAAAVFGYQSFAEAVRKDTESSEDQMWETESDTQRILNMHSLLADEWARLLVSNLCESDIHDFLDSD